MGLISKTAKVKWNGSSRNWYESKGYVFTKTGDEFEVRVQDLKYSSKALVDVQCDCEDCTTPIIKPVVWRNYLKCVKEDGKYYCRKCSNKLFAHKTANKNKLKNGGKSFYDWCIKHNRKDILDRWDYELNGCSPSEINYASSKRYWFKCSRGIHDSELKGITNFTGDNGGSLECNKCNSIGQYILDVYGENGLKNYWDYEKNNALSLYPFKINKTCNKKIWIFCQAKTYHNSYNVRCGDFTTKNSRCPYCTNRNGKVHHLDSLGNLLKNNNLLKTWSERNKKYPYEYTPNSGKSVYWKCENGIHDDYKRIIHTSNTCGFRCPECVRERDESILQEKVRLYLESLGYEVLHENKCTLNPTNMVKPPCGEGKKRICGNLRYDNEIVVNEKHIVIEVNGQQHYQINTWHKNFARKYKTTPELELKYQQDRDKYKKEYALSKGYQYLEIPYWTIEDENESYKTLIDNKINEISNKK